ncbi:MAG TPA: metal-dependent hydrolase [Chloroflexota bacterium]
MSANGDLKITWLGHATTRIDTADGKVILIDPWLQGNPAVQESHKSIDRVDLMLVTHAHSDHMGDAVSIAKQTGCSVIAIFDFCQYLAGKGIENCNGINKGGTAEWEGIQITMVDAVHSSGFEEDGVFISGGDPAGFVIRFPDGFTVYHAGDTDVFESMKLIGRLYEPDLAILPIGDHFTMGPRSAAEAIRLLGVTRVIPIHYATFPLLTGTPEQLKKETSDITGLKIMAIKPGESVTQIQIV